MRRRRGRPLEHEHLRETCQCGHVILECACNIRKKKKRIIVRSCVVCRERLIAEAQSIKPVEPDIFSFYESWMD